MGRRDGRMRARCCALSDLFSRSLVEAENKGDARERRLELFVG